MKLTKILLNWLIVFRACRCEWEITNSNPDKTEFILINGNKNRNPLRSTFSVSLLGSVMEPAKTVKNLGATLDADKLIQRHMANLCHVFCTHLWE